MGMVSISREDYPNAAGSHAGSKNIDEWLKKKYDIQQQEADANTMLADARRIEADSLAKQRNWEWNPDLESSKGVGGYRFLDLARQKNLDVSTIDRNNANADMLSAVAEGQKLENDFNKEINPYRIKNSIAAGKLNTATYNGEFDAQEEKNYQAWKASNLAKPEWADDPYKPAVIPERSGWLSKLLKGNLYNPLNPMVTAQQKAEDIQRKKIATANALFLQNNPEYRY